MKIEIAKSDLVASLSVAVLAVAAGSDLSSHYLFRLKDGKVEVLAANMRIFARSPLICNVSPEGGEAFTVEAWRLDKWLSGTSDGVVKISSENGEVQVSSGKSKVRLRSLDPSKFPYWDELFKKSSSGGSISPQTLSRAIGFARWFVSADDTSKPELCQIEAVKGVIWATDRRALSSVQVPALPDLNIRIPGKDVGPLSRFLSAKTTLENTIEIREAEREGGGGCAFFVRPDGSYFGVARPTSNFPKLDVDRNASPECSLKMGKEEFFSALSVLSSAAPKDHKLVTFQMDQETKVVSLSMPCEAGGTDEFPLSSAQVTNPDKFTAPFTVDHPYIKGVVDCFDKDDIEFGIMRKGKSGFISFKDEDKDVERGNQYFSVILWRT